MACREISVCVLTSVQFCFVIRSCRDDRTSFVADSNLSIVYPSFARRSDSSNASDARKIATYARNAASKCIMAAGPVSCLGKEAKHRLDCFTISPPKEKARRRSSVRDCPDLEDEEEPAVPPCSWSSVSLLLPVISEGLHRVKTKFFPPSLDGPRTPNPDPNIWLLPLYSMMEVMRSRCR